MRSLIRLSMRQELQKKLVLQSSAETFLVERGLGSLLLEQAQGKTTQQGEILGRVTDTHARGVLAENDIERPMAGIFNGPMVTNGL